MSKASWLTYICIGASIVLSLISIVVIVKRMAKD